VTAPGDLDLMRRIKALLDPQGLMNPGKILLSPAH
jgi:FAD/FMN-containing dehydrogenase